METGVYLASVTRYSTFNANQKDVLLSSKHFTRFVFMSNFIARRCIYIDINMRI